MEMVNNSDVPSNTFATVKGDCCN